MDLCRKKKQSHKRVRIVTLLVLLVSLMFVGCDIALPQESTTESAEVTELLQDPATEESPAYNLSDIPEYDGFPYVILRDNQPDFQKSDLTTESFQTFSKLDALGRCGVAFANVGPDLMPAEERGDIGQIRPSGWHLVKYDNVDGKFLYNRCHLIAYHLTGENASGQNLITGTRYLNTEGMLPFENRVVDYVRKTGNHVLYRVTAG